MKIESSTSPTVGLSKTRQARPAGSGAAPAPTSEAGSVSLGAVANTEAAGAPFDAQRVAEIRQAIVEGKLQIDPERIADRLIDGAREQLAKEGRS